MTGAQPLTKPEPVSPLISETYKQLNAKLHETNPAYGISGKRYARYVRQIAARNECRTILDYGCGKQTLKEAMAPDWDVIGYDPCIPGLDDPPEPADMLVCTDVLEHIEPEYLDDVMRDIRRLMLKAGFLAVDTVEAQKFLADGRNAHLTIEDGQWWLRRLMDYFHILQFEEHERKIIAAVK